MHLPRTYALVALAAPLLLAACGTPPAGLDRTLQHPSQQGKFVVRMEPPASGPAIHQMHSWQLSVTTPEGAPVRAARIAIDGGMPQHGHGLPTRPRVTGEPVPGTYRIDGMKFSMTGWWDLRVAIQAGDGADTAVFNLVLDENGLQR